MSRFSTFVVFSVVIGAVRPAAGSPSSCMLAVTNSIDDVLDAGVYMWGAIERCKETGETVRCSSDIFSIVENVVKMSSWIVKSMKACGGSSGAKQCELTSLKFAAASAGLTSASLEMSAACKPQLAAEGKEFPLTGNANCLANIGGALTSLGSTIADLTQVKKTCGDAAHCTASVMDILSAIAHMGECIWQTVEGSCVIDSALKPYNNCVQATVHASESLLAIGSAGLTMASDCKMVGPSKLYESSDLKMSTTSSMFTPLNTGLAALFPLTAVVAFIRGTRDAKKNLGGAQEDIQPLQSSVE